MRELPQGNRKPRRNKVANMVLLEGTFTMSKVNIVGLVKEVVLVIKVKAGVKIKPGPHFGRSPTSLIPGIVIL